MTRLVYLVALLAAGACGGSTNNDTGSGGSSGSSGSGGVAGAAANDCIEQGGWCAYTDGACGKSVACFCQAQRPESCDDTEYVVCGCDGQTYHSECEAQRAGVDVHRDEWVCQASEYEEECGWLRCGSEQVCMKTYTDRPGPSSYACVHVGQCQSCDCVEPVIEDAACSCVNPEHGRPYIECHLLL